MTAISNATAASATSSEHTSGAGDLNPAAAALVEVYVVGSDAGGDDEVERGEEAEDVGGDGVGGAAEYGGDGRRVVAVGFHELVKWEPRGLVV